MGSPDSHRDGTEFVVCIITGSEAVSGHRALLYGSLHLIKKKKIGRGQGEAFKTLIVLPWGLFCPGDCSFCQ